MELALRGAHDFEQGQGRSVAEIGESPCNCQRPQGSCERGNSLWITQLSYRDRQMQAKLWSYKMLRSDAACSSLASRCIRILQCLDACGTQLWSGSRSMNPAGHPHCYNPTMGTPAPNPLEHVLV